MRFINRSSACRNKTALFHPHSQPLLATRKISIVHHSINDPQDEEEMKGFWSGQEERAVCYTISAWRCTDVLSRQLTATATDNVSATAFEVTNCAQTLAHCTGLIWTRLASTFNLVSECTFILQTVHELCMMLLIPPSYVLYLGSNLESACISWCNLTMEWLCSVS
jgi:hypothetical protein